MEMSQGNSLHSYLKQKCHFFSFYKIGEQNGGTGPAWGGGWLPWVGAGGGERVWQGEYSTNTVYTCMKLEKCYLLKPFQEWGWMGLKEIGGGCEFKHDTFDIL
jgi:hypothetical protein